MSDKEKSTRKHDFEVLYRNIEAKTGNNPDVFVKLAREKGLMTKDIKATQVINWLKDDFSLGHGHAMALWLFLKQHII